MRLGLPKDVVLMLEFRSAWKIFVGGPKRKKSIALSWHMCDDPVEVDSKETCSEDLEWTQVI